MSKKPVQIIVCSDPRSRNVKFVCVKGFDARAKRKGIEQHCLKCIREDGTNNIEA